MASDPIAGVYVGNSPGELSRHEDWLGRPAEAVLAYTSDQSWQDMDPGWIMSQFPDRPLLFSIPLFPVTSSLEEVANGDGNAQFRDIAETIFANADQVAAPDGSIYVRTAWEMGGDWMAWTVQGNDNPELFAEAFRNFADAFHDVSDRFQIVWDIAFDKGGGPKFYPGDDYVDVVSQDLYWFPEWYGDDGEAAFEVFLNEEYGPAWLEDFADQRGKATAYSEWGAPAGYDTTAYIEAMRGWFEDPDNNTVYHTFWDSNADYPGLVADGSDPITAAAYRDAFL